MIDYILATIEIIAQDQPPEVVDPKNPFQGVVPNFEVFGVEFTAAWQKLLGGIWGIAFVLAAFGAIRAVLELQHAKKGGYQTSVHEHTESAKRSGFAVAALAALGIIFGAVIALF